MYKIIKFIVSTLLFFTVRLQRKMLQWTIHVSTVIAIYITNTEFKILYFLSVLYGYRSPTSFSTTGNGTNGNTNGGAMPLSPSQGRSLREYDEKLRALQKENFNLKLRLFFLDEKPPGTTASNAVNNGGTNGSSKSIGDDETLFKQNIDLKVCYFNLL